MVIYQQAYQFLFFFLFSFVKKKKTDKFHALSCKKWGANNGRLAVQNPSSGRSSSNVRSKFDIENQKAETWFLFVLVCQL